MVTKVKAPSYTAQQKAYVASYKAATNPASKLKPTVVIEDVTLEPTPSKSVFDEIKGLAAKLDIKLPSFTRVACSWIACILTGFGIGFIAAPIIDMIALAALTMSGSLTFGLIVYVLSMCVLLCASYFVGRALDNYIMSGSIDRSYQKCSAAVRSFFSFGNREVTS